jgi:hypothetical protein
MIKTQDFLDRQDHVTRVITTAFDSMNQVIVMTQKVRDDLSIAGAPLSLIDRYDTVLNRLFDLQGDTNHADFTNPFTD